MDDIPAFSGFTPVAFAWLEDLAADNTRERFAASEPTYERELRGPFTAMLGRCAADSGGEVRVFRQLRDQRFAANRAAPYWLSVAGEVAGRPGTAAVLHASLSCDGLTVAAGYRRPFSAEQLGRYRTAADRAATGVELQDIADALRRDGVVLGGATLRTVPRGVARAHPRAALLRHTALTGGVTLAPDRRRRCTRPRLASTRTRPSGTSRRSGSG
jgi:uncharacterized protein (DUF2461 family)